MTGGATVSPDTAKAYITYAASDYPFGQFEFDSSDPVTVSEVNVIVSFYLAIA